MQDLTSEQINAQINRIADLAKSCGIETDGDAKLLAAMKFYLTVKIECRCATENDYLIYRYLVA